MEDSSENDCRANDPKEIMETITVRQEVGRHKNY